MTVTTRHHRIVVVGGGTAGVTVAARLRRRGEQDVALVEPSVDHWYQPLWTLVAAGEVALERTRRPEWSVVPKGVTWYRDRVAGFEPDQRRIVLDRGGALEYDALVVALGIDVDWDGIPGVGESVGHPGLGVSSVYRPDLAEATWPMLRSFEGGTALFTMPHDPIKCGGAPQKIMYLSADHFRRSGVASRTEIVFGAGTAKIFGVPEFAEVLEGVVERYGIDTRFHRELISIEPGRREATFDVYEQGEVTGRETVDYDFLHVVPHMRAPAVVRGSPLADPSSPGGWAEVDQYTLQHPRHPDVFALGDCAGAPNSKTGAAVRKQAPVVVDNVLSQLGGRSVQARYDGYSSCPLVTGYGRLLLAEFDYSGRPHPTIPLIDTVQERHDMWLLKRYGLPFMYWNLMLRGLA